MLRVIELFAGIGSQTQALKNIGVDHDVVAIAEIDKYAIKSYEAIHGQKLNLGDVSTVDVDDIPNCDLLTYSFPCQDISVAGKQKGLDKDSNTRSSLLWECERIIKAKRPKYLLLENVKNLVGKKHKPNFDKWLETLESVGYNNYWKVLNAKDYGIPQNRERVFVVSILKEFDNGKFEFPEEQKLTLCLKDLLEDKVDEKFYLSKEMHDRFVFKPQGDNVIGTTKLPTQKIGQRELVYRPDRVMGALISTDYKQPKRILLAGNIEGCNFDQQSRVYNSDGVSPTLNTMSGGDRQPKVLIKNATKKGYLEAEVGDGISLSHPNSSTRRGRVQKQISSTLDTSCNQGVLENGFKIRKLTPLECWRLMGFDDDAFYKAEKVNSNTQLYKQAGNSIVVPVLEGIFRNMLEVESE